MYFLRHANFTVEAGPIESRGSVRGDKCFKAEVSGHPSCRRNAVVGGEANEDQGFNAELSQIRFEFGADKRRVDRLPIDRLSCQRFCVGFGGVPRCAAPQQSLGIERIVVGMDDGHCGRAPRLDQLRDIGFRRWIIARTPLGVIKSDLHIDHQQGGISTNRVQAHSPCDPWPVLALQSARVQNDDEDIGNSDGIECDGTAMNKDLEVRHCRVLVAVHESGGVVAAARVLGLAQSTVSETMLSLGRLLGTPVTLRRAGREATLSPAAEALLPHAQALILASEAALSAVSGQRQHILRLGTVESVSSFLLPGPLSAFRQSWPDFDVQVTIGLCEDLRRRVRRFELDAAITIDGVDRPGESEQQWNRSLASAQLGLLVSPRHPLAKTIVGQADLKSRNLLLADPEGAFNGLVRAWFRDERCQPKLESAGSVDGVKRAIQNNNAIGVLPTYSAAKELASGSLIALKVRETLPILALRLSTREPPLKSSPLHALTEQVREAFRQELGA